MTSQLADFMVPKFGANARLDATTRVFGADDVRAMSVAGVDWTALGRLEPNGVYEAFVEGAVLYDGERPEDAVAGVAPWAAAAGSELVVFTPDPRLLSASYLCCVLRSERFVDHACRVRDLRRGRGIQYAKLLEFPINLPSLERQQVIAHRFATIASLIGKQTLALGALEHAPAALFDAAFGDPVANPRAFPTVPLADCGIRVRSTAPDTIPRPRVTASNVGVGFVDRMSVKALPPSEGDVSFEPLDVLIVSIGSPVLRAALAPERLGAGFASNALFVVRADARRFHPAFLAAFLNHPSVLRAATRLSAGTSVRRLAASSLFGMRVPVPTLASQNAFAAHLSKVEDLATLADHANQAMTEASVALESSLFSLDADASNSLPN